MKKKTKVIISAIIILFFVVWTLTILYHSLKPYPKGMNILGEIHNIDDSDIKFLYDLTSFDYENNTKLERVLSDQIVKKVEDADDFVLINTFLFLAKPGGEENKANIIKEELIKKKQENPKTKINFVTDEYVTNYHSYTPTWLKDLEDSGINIVLTRLDKLRDPNRAYSGIWRTYIRIWGTKGNGWIGNSKTEPEKKTKIRSYLKKLNYKFDHRKVILTEENNELYTILSSGNLRDLERPYSDTGVLIKGDFGREVIEYEKATAKLSNSEIEIDEIPQQQDQEGNISIQLITETKIGKEIIKDLDSTQEGDQIKIATFLLSYDKIIDSLLRASKRGVEINIVLDPSNDLFDMKRHGIPNRAIAKKLIKKSKGKIKIRWYNTGQEQFHTKLTYIIKADQTITSIGSANHVDKSMGKRTHPEANVMIHAPIESNFSNDVEDYFEKIWNNQGSVYTLDYEQHQNYSKFFWIVEKIIK